VSMVIKPSFESYSSVQSRPSTSPSHSRPQTDRTRRASRKPVPVYDPSEFNGPDSVSPSGLSEPISAGKKWHFIFPDPLPG
jgi:hypothetical protein